MQGWNIAEEAHIVNALPPVDIAGGATADRFSMSKFAHASIIVSIGVSAAAPTAILVKSCTAASAGTATAIPFRYYAETTAAGDTLGAKAEATASGITTVSANDGIFYVIELDAAELESDAPWVEVEITNASGNSVIASVVAVLSGGRYVGSATGITAIA